ncbi:MAG: hypothetical protein ABFR47_04885 [Verrucomicrobiota bacterium]
MEATSHFNQNRPVHLALRDVHYERATSLLKDPCHMAIRELDAANYEEILFLLRTAREHCWSAIRDNGKNENDGQFCKFINMLAGNVKAVLAMLNLKNSVEADDGFFFSFLEANRASVALQAEEHERRARDIIRSLLSMLELADNAFEGLKQANYDAFSGSERERYKMAAAHHRELIEQRPELPEYRKKTGIFR